MTNRERAELYREQRDRALAVVDDIDDGTTFYEARGSETMKDVTAIRRAEKLEGAKMFDELALAWERLG